MTRLACSGAIVLSLLIGCGHQYPPSPAGRPRLQNVQPHASAPHSENADRFLEYEVASHASARLSSQHESTHATREVFDTDDTRARVARVLLGAMRSDALVSVRGARTCAHVCALCGQLDRRLDEP